MLSDLLIKNRSFRRFEESVNVSVGDLREMVDAARVSASARNAQPLKYILIQDRERCEAVFPCLAWAGYLKDWPGPEEGERPSAYIVQLHDTSISASYFCDDGIAAQSILLTAVEKGLGGCIIASVKRDELSKILQIPGHLKIIQVIALGKPAEKVVLEEIRDNDIKYWRDEAGVHHVPKRSVDDLIFDEGRE